METSLFLLLFLIMDTSILAIPSSPQKLEGKDFSVSSVRVLKYTTAWEQWYSYACTELKSISNLMQICSISSD